ncbi:hypothetical protein OHA18_40320 [Kribbella sp. NBC_00709]|uniref:hypothetical protein n=1 Tax=Kribbella sp. NBC_00709 TaxID=2975972 RepID=UPI002E2C5201|nr:hypothetical protein [Kribbella sp. NBC_00709]
MRRLLRCAAVLAAGLGFGLACAAPAGAAVPQPVAPGELSKATSAAHSPDAARLLAKVPGTAKAAASVGSDSHAVYALNPAFVRDASAPVATFWYAATAASKGGQALTVFTAPDASGAWKPVNVATGNTEARMATAADGALLFTEPQVGAWYALTAGQVRPLNPSAVKSIGAKPITVAAYQDLVSHRYSDKQPGSTYNDLGMAGGYDTTAATQSTVAAATSRNYIVPISAGAGAAAFALLLVVRRKMSYSD